jgi:hypothetical protein
VAEFAVTAVNDMLIAAFDAVCWPLRALPPLWALAFVSSVTGILAVWALGRLSNQVAIRRVRARISGNLLGLRLFRHDVGLVLGLQRRILRDTLLYMTQLVMPALVVLGPVALAMAQLDLRFAVRPLRPGETALVTARVRDSAALTGSVRLEAPAGVAIETPGVRVAGRREVTWRVRALDAGVHALAVSIAGDEAVTKQLAAGPDWGVVPRTRTGRGAVDQLLRPGEAPIAPDRTVEAIEVGYPPLDLELFGWRFGWLTGFLLTSLASGLAAKGLLGVAL